MAPKNKLVTTCHSDSQTNVPTTDDLKNVQLSSKSNEASSMRHTSGGITQYICVVTKAFLLPLVSPPTSE